MLSTVNKVCFKYDESVHRKKGFTGSLMGESVVVGRYPGDADNGGNHTQMK